MVQKNAMKQSAEHTEYQVVTPIDLELQDKEISFSPESLTQYINVLRQNWRQGNRCL